jgi:L-gulonate 5-dehydrogenase
MKAAIFEAPFRMRVGPWEQPVPGPEEVVIEVKAAGICAGDMHIYSGKSPYAKFPVIGGHEICGAISRLGEKVSNFEVGQLVVVEPFLSCGTCYPCRVGKPNCCARLQIIGVHRPGGYAEFVLAPATHLHVVPSNLSPLWAAFAEPVTIGIHACRRAGVVAGEYILVLGCGPIGLAIIEVALAKKAHVVAVDLNEQRLETARSLGAEVLPGSDNLVGEVLGQTNQEGAPVVIEATGSPAVMESTVDLVASGGRIVIVGLTARAVGVKFPGLDFTRKELTILGSRTEVNCFPEALTLLASGHISFPRTASEFSLWSAPEVFDNLSQHPGKIQKGVFVRNPGAATRVPGTKNVSPR